MKRAILLLLLTIPGFCWAQVSYRNVPEPVIRAFEKSKTFANYDLSDKINPFYLRGDFDGDGIPDYAVLVRNKKTGHIGIAVVRSKAAKVEVLGAGGIGIRNGSGSDSYVMDDYDWMDAWQVARKQRLEPDDREGGDLHLRQMIGEALMVEKTESASGFIYFDGQHYRWYQLGD